MWPRRSILHVDFTWFHRGVNPKSSQSITSVSTHQIIILQYLQHNAQRHQFQINHWRVIKRSCLGFGKFGMDLLTQREDPSLFYKQVNSKIKDMNKQWHTWVFSCNCFPFFASWYLVGMCIHYLKCNNNIFSPSLPGWDKPDDITITVPHFLRLHKT